MAWVDLTGGFAALISAMALWDRYLFLLWVRSFGLGLAALVGILVLENLQNELGDFLRWQAPWSEVGRFYVAYVAGQLPLVLPVAHLLAVLFTLSRLHQQQELTAGQAAGRSLLQLTRSLWWGSLLLAVGTGWLVFGGASDAAETTRLLRETWRLRAEADSLGAQSAGLVAPLAYREEIRDTTADRAAAGGFRLWLMNRFSRLTEEGFGVVLSDFDASGREVERWLCRELFWDGQAGYWVAVEGRRLTLDRETGLPVHQVVFEREPLPSWNAAPDRLLAFQRPPSQLSFRELTALLANPELAADRRAAPYALRRGQLALQPLQCLVVMVVALPLAATGVRRNPWINLTRAGGLLAVFFALTSIAGLLAQQGHLPLEVALALPGAVILLAMLPAYRGVL